VETSDGAVQADSGPSVVEVDDGTAKTMEIARADASLMRTSSPTQSSARAVAERTVCRRWWRAWTASAIAVRCSSSSPLAIVSSSERAGAIDAGGESGGFRRPAVTWG